MTVLDPNFVSPVRPIAPMTLPAMCSAGMAHAGAVGVVAVYQYAYARAVALTAAHAASEEARLRRSEFNPSDN